MALKISSDTKVIIITEEERIFTNNTTIGKGWKEQNPFLKEIVIPEGILEIEEEAFANCSHLTKVTLPSTLRKIGRNAFVGCKALEQVVVPDAIAEIKLWDERHVWSVNPNKPFTDLHNDFVKGHEVELFGESDSRSDYWD